MQGISPNSRKSYPDLDKERAVNAAAENPTRIISDIIGPRVQLGVALEDIAERTGITVRRVRAYFHGEVAKPRPIEVRALRQLRDEAVSPRTPAGFVDRAEFERLKADKDAEIASLRADITRVQETIALAAALGAGGFSRTAREQMAASGSLVDGG